MFGRPKRAKAVAKPRNQAEKDKVNIALAKKYPQMFKSGWGTMKSKGSALSAAARGLHGSTAKQYNSLSKGDKAEIDRILGKGR